MTIPGPEARHRRETFDQIADLYDCVRPGYPEAVFDDVVALSGIPPGGRILEIGCGTGKATVPFARRGFAIQGIELGAQLAEVARRNLASYPDSTVSVGAFETWGVEPRSFDLVTAATAFHWIDPRVGFRKAAEALKEGGSIALLRNLHVATDLSAVFFAEVQAVYERCAPELARRFEGVPSPEEAAFPEREAIERSGLFGEVTERRYLWHVPYDAASYADLLATYSDHGLLEVEARASLLQGVTRLIDERFGGRVYKEHLTVLALAGRR